MQAPAKGERRPDQSQIAELSVLSATSVTTVAKDQWSMRKEQEKDTVQCEGVNLTKALLHR